MQRLLADARSVQTERQPAVGAAPAAEGVCSEGGAAVLAGLLAALPFASDTEREVVRCVLIARGGAKAAWVRAEFEAYLAALQEQAASLAHERHSPPQGELDARCAPTQLTAAAASRYEASWEGSRSVPT